MRGIRSSSALLDGLRSRVSFTVAIIVALGTAVFAALHGAPDPLEVTKEDVGLHEDDIVQSHLSTLTGKASEAGPDLQPRSVGDGRC